MSLILNIETSTELCSVCLADKYTLLSKRNSFDEKSHASQLTIFIEEIFAEFKISVSDLSAIAVSQGPGSYTGLRIGVSTAKGIAYAADKPLIAVDSYNAMANAVKQQIFNNKDFVSNYLLCPMIDAKRMEVYTSLYNSDLETIEKINAKIIDENSFTDLLSKQRIYFFGNGSDKFKNIIKSENAVFVENIFSYSEYMIQQSYTAFQNQKFEDIAYFEPFYLKDFVASLPKKNILK